MCEEPGPIPHPCGWISLSSHFLVHAEQHINYGLGQVWAWKHPNMLNDNTQTADTWQIWLASADTVQ